MGKAAEYSLTEILQAAIQDRDMLPQEIPAINLYMDQIITLFEEHISPGGRSAKDKPLTKTMVNNYSKDGIIKPVKGKKYTGEQIMQMLYIYRLKQTLSIGDIRRVLCYMPSDEEGSQRESLVAAYQGFQNKKAQASQTLLAFVNSLCPEESPDMARVAELILELAWISYTSKKMCEALIDCYMPEQEQLRNTKKQEKAKKQEDREDISAN